MESEVQGSVTGFFGFHVVKHLMPILALLPKLCVCETPINTKYSDSETWLTLSIYNLNLFHEINNICHVVNFTFSHDQLLKGKTLEFSLNGIEIR